MAKGRRLTQSRSVQGFKPFIIKQRTEDNLPDHLKGAALWREVDNEEGYWVYDYLGLEYLTAEYNKDKDQWYFVRHDTRSRNWVATEPVPTEYRVERRVKAAKVSAIPVEDHQNTFGQCNCSNTKTGNIESFQSGVSLIRE